MARARARRGLQLALGLAIACGDDDAREASSTQARDVAVSELAERLDEPAQETVVIAVRSLPAAFDPFSALDPWARRIVDDALFEGLTRRDPRGAPWYSPVLAEECRLELERSSTTVHCRLAEGHRFHDDSPVTPDDALFSVERWTRANAHALRARHGLSSLREVTLLERIPAAGGETAEPKGDVEPEMLPGPWLRLRFDRSEPLALERIAAIKIVPRAAYSGQARDLARAPIGSGPMKLEFVGDGRLVLEATEPARVDERAPTRIVFRVLPDGAQALTLARRGEVDIVDSLAPLYVPDELAKPGMAARFHAVLLSPARYDLVIYNTRRGVLADPALREALDGVLPREHIARALYRQPALASDAPVDRVGPIALDLAALAAGDLEAAHLVPRWTLERPSAAVSEQRDAARQAAAASALDALHWPLDRGLRRRPGGNLRVPLMWDGSKGFGADITGAVREAWRSIGVQAPNVTASWSYLQQKPIREGTFDAVVARLALASDADLYPYFHSDGRLNYSGVRDDALDAALEAYRAAASVAERDAARETIAARVAALRVVSVLYAPLTAMLITRSLELPEFADDLPRLDRLRLRR